MARQRSALLVALTGLHFLTLHGPNGQEFFVNAEQITSLREPTGDDLKHFPRGTHCVVVTTSGKFLAVREACREVKDLLQKKSPPGAG